MLANDLLVYRFRMVDMPLSFDMKSVSLFILKAIVGLMWRGCGRGEERGG